MIGIVGTVPDLQLPLIHGKARLRDNHFEIKGRSIAINRGTPALIGAALKASECVHCPETYAFLVGDIGKGDGSRKLYDFLTRHLHEFDFKVLTFHYLQPDVDWHNKVLFAFETMQKRPLLIADAGFMYAAKMSGQSDQVIELIEKIPQALVKVLNKHKSKIYYASSIHNENCWPAIDIHPKTVLKN